MPFIIHRIKINMNEKQKTTLWLGNGILFLFLFLIMPTDMCVIKNKKEQRNGSDRLNWIQSIAFL